MKDFTFTVRNVTAGRRNTAGDLVLRTIGNITVTLQAMTRTEVADWADITDALNTRGIDADVFRLTLNGWKVIHPEAGIVGLLFQGAGTRVHVEWHDTVNDDYFSAAWVRNLRHGAAAIVNARQHAGQGLPADARPEPFQAPAATARPVRLANGSPVRYHGTFAMTLGDLNVTAFRVYDCDHGDCACGGYELRTTGLYEPVALHVRPESVTTLDVHLAAA